MACLLSFTRRNLYTKCFCFNKTSSPLHHHIKYYTEPTLQVPSLLIRRFHMKVSFFEDIKKASFAKQVCCSRVLLCSHISSSSSSTCKPEDSCMKFDAFGHVVEELAPEKPVEEAMATKATVIDEFTSLFESLSFPEDYVQYVINGIHELTGFNWWISIVLTAFLVNGLMSPVTLLIQRKIWELRILVRCIQKVNRVMKTCDPKSLAKYKKWEEKWMEKFVDCCLSFMPLASLHAAINLSFLNGISVMAKTTPGFENGGILFFTTHNSFYILPLLTGLTFWLTLEYPPISSTKLLSRMKTLPLALVVFITVHATNELEPAVYFYLVSFRIFVYTLFSMLRSKQIVKLRRSMGWPDLPVTVSEEQRIMERVISLMRDFIDVVNKKDKK